MKNVITIAIALTTLAAGWLLGKHFGDVQYIEKPVVQIQMEYVDTCLTMVKIDDKLQGIKKGTVKRIAEIVPEPTVLEDMLDTRPITDLSSLQAIYNIPIQRYEWNYNDSLVSIREVAVVRGEVIAFDREVKLDTPLVAAYPIKPNIIAETIGTAIGTFTNPTYNPNLGKGKEVNIIMGGLYNFKPELDAMGGYTLGANVRFEGGSTVGLTYNNIAKIHYAGFQITLPVIKLQR
jgi:hypothetical protein